MKVELQIKETYEEEKLDCPNSSADRKVQKVIEFVENLDQKETIKGKIDDQVYLLRRYKCFYIENRKVLAEIAGVRPTALIYDSIKFLTFCRPHFYPNFPIRNR